MDSNEIYHAAGYPIYVSDEGRVTCNEGGAECDGEFLHTLPARRVEVEDFLMALKKHRIEVHGEQA